MWPAKLCRTLTSVSVMCSIISSLSQRADLNGVAMLERMEERDLHTLGTVIVDYRGYRIVAQSIIPGTLPLCVTPFVYHSISLHISAYLCYLCVSMLSLYICYLVYLCISVILYIFAYLCNSYVSAYPCRTYACNHAVVQ